MTNDDQQAAADELRLERIEAQILERRQQSEADYLRGELEATTTMYLRDVLKHIVADILQRHIAAATGEIASAMADEIEALARYRLADLRTQIEAGSES